jgi:hypothetical protein
MIDSRSAIARYPSGDAVKTTVRSKTRPGSMQPVEGSGGHILDVGAHRRRASPTAAYMTVAYGSATSAEVLIQSSVLGHAFSQARVRGF